MLQCGPEIAPGGRRLLAATVTLPAGVLGWGTGVCGCVVVWCGSEGGVGLGLVWNLPVSRP